MADYDASRKKKVEKDPEKYGGSTTWEDDRIEKAHMVWEWWHVKAIRFNYFFTAARLVALVPI